ncbi:unnamed protein product [Triticum turgidum subsp. durum]|uniref:Pentacotripeptide-repeat region of PRORP domain-containing protein n=1 Tax=Triticum turgidum subsp. durum TaxID=4567 RepID=A0A9R0WP88_TRITD|nr:unnamed protein product [Triticum turgidum subsp. durum]
MAGFGFHPTLADFHSLLFALCHNGLVNHAEVFFRESGAHFDVSAKTYTILISGWAVVEKPENAQKLFDEMVERGVEPDVPAYNALIDALCRGGDIARAQEHLKDMQQSRGLVPDAATYGPFLRAACASKDARDALRVLDRMRMHDLTPNVFTYNAIIRLLCELGEIEEAYSVPDRHSYNMLLKLLIGVGRIDKAVEVWDGMETRGFHPGAATYAVMIHGLSCKKGRLEEACGYFVMMVDEGIPPYQATCEVLRDRLTRHGLRDQLEVLIDRMRRSTSCTIQEMASIMRSTKRADETRSTSSDQELPGHDLDENEWRGKWKLGD